ncbi:MAG: YheC/YheD family protein [Syntrophomonas sp.]
MANNCNYSCIVGVLSNGEVSNGAFPSGKKARLFKEMLTCAEQRKILLYFFYRVDVDWGREIIRGFTWDNKYGWIKRNYPFPDVVYNRIRFRKFESLNETRKLLKKFEERPKIHLFNSRFLNKWEVYQAITRHPDGAKVVPDTIIYNQINLKNFLDKYKEVYLKPVNGSLGKGIIKVVFSSGSYQFAIAQKKQIKWSKCHSFDTLYKQLESIEGVSRNKYLVQRSINLARYEGRVFDLRTQTQKDGLGQWVFTGVGVRIAGENRIVTHIPNGGSAASYEEIIKKTFGTSKEKKESIDNQLKHIGELVPMILEENLGINLAVLSMDIGIDSEGKVWVLEVNSKPSSFDEDDIRKKHLKYLLDYCIYATRNNE